MFLLLLLLLAYSHCCYHIVLSYCFLRVVVLVLVVPIVASGVQSLSSSLSSFVVHCHLLVTILPFLLLSWGIVVSRCFALFRVAVLVLVHVVVVFMFCHVLLCVLYLSLNLITYIICRLRILFFIPTLLVIHPDYCTPCSTYHWKAHVISFPMMYDLSM